MKGFKQLICLVISFYVIGRSEACDLVGGTIVGVPVPATVVDVFRGTFLEIETFDVLSITSSTTSSTNYVVVTLEGSTLELSTADAFAQYEEVEVNAVFGVTVTLQCVGGQTKSVIFQITVVDTNNNDPVFLPNNEFEFTVTPPLPQNYALTGCLQDIVVRDIDLTTSRIDFDILDDNEYFRIDYAGRGNAKEFKALLETKTLVRTLPEKLTLRISATDVDNTGDPRRTVYGTIRINSNGPFIPADLKFSETYYFGHYNSESHQVTLDDTIYLTQGYDAEVNFILESDYEDYFSIITNGNDIAIEVKQQLSSDVIRIENQILLVIRAQRELVEDATAAIILQLPKATPLQFEEAHYEGLIEDNELSLPALVLIQGYQGVNISVRIESEHNSFFSYTLQENIITITINEMDQNVIDVNNYLSLRVIASTDSSSAVTVVSLEIIKDDNMTPVFEKPVYFGSYEAETGLDLEQIVIVQGYDNTVDVALQDHNDWFIFEQNGATLTLRALDIPSEVFVEKKLILSILASKPRTVGATTIVYIDLPQVRELSFEASTYKGSLQDDQQFTHENIILKTGYGEDVNFTLSGEYSEHFQVTNTQNQVFINLLPSLPNSAILENNILSLTLNAVGFHTTQATAVILIETIKDDISTPVFAQDIYFGSYLLGNNIEMESISLRQGFDSSVTFSLDGDNSEYFEFSQTDNTITFSVKADIPEELIFREKVLVFSIFASKPLTVGGRATISIQFPEELSNLATMKFSRNTYMGVLENNDLSLEPVVLDSGYNENTFFNLSGDYEQHFELTNVNNVVSITLRENSSAGIFENIPFIVLEVAASRERAVSVSASVLIEINHEKMLQPLFEKHYYVGVYNGDELQFVENIMLIQGYDDTVEFSLDEESSSWFYLVQTGESLSLVLNDLPAEIVESNDYLILSIIASKPSFQPARAAIIIDIPKDTKVLAFEMPYYVGILQSDYPIVQNILLISSDGTVPTTNVTLQGDLEQYFFASIEAGAVTITLLSEISEESLQSNNVIILTLEASSHGYISARSNIVIEVPKEDVISIVNDLEFSELHYVGLYTDADGLTFNNRITLAEGYTEEVEFNMTGGDSQWFTFTTSGNSVTLLLSNAIPDDILEDNHQLLFFVTASKPGSVLVRTTIVISLLKDIHTEQNSLSFEKHNYVGTLQNDSPILQNIILTSSDGTIPATTVTVQGDLGEYFSASIENGTVTIALLNEISEELISSKSFIILTLQASSPGYSPAYTTIVIEIEKEDMPPILNDLEFTKLYYTGHYTEAGGLSFSDNITLAEGYTEEVEFNFSGDDSQWFVLSVSENSVSIELRNWIPNEILLQNNQLVFFVTASKPGSILAKTTVIISLLEDIILDHNTLYFETHHYLGMLQHNSLDLQDMAVISSNGTIPLLTLTLQGDLEENFSASYEDGLVTVIFSNQTIPEELLPYNNLIILTLRASSPGYSSAYTTIIIVVQREDVTPIVNDLEFHELYYVGHYTGADGLTFSDTIALTEGYTEEVEFALVGDDSQWFGITVNENLVILQLNSSIPEEVLLNRPQLIFFVTAFKPGSISARTTVVISLMEDIFSELNYLSFEKHNYVGTLQNDSPVLQNIILTSSDGTIPATTITLQGDLEEYFSASIDNGAVTIILLNAIPEELLFNNSLIILTLQASSPGYSPAYTTVIIELEIEDVIPIVNDLVFSELYYIGNYTEAYGLSFSEIITLAEGYTEEIVFELSGGDSQWFNFTANGNSVILQLRDSIPQEVIIMNYPLVFFVTASKPRSSLARTTIVISLSNDGIEIKSLYFENDYYVGTINNTEISLPTIQLREEYSDEVTFALYGEFSHFFKVIQGPNVLILFTTEVQEEFPTNINVVVLELEATAPEFNSARASVILEIVEDLPLETILLDEIYYTGIYFENELKFSKPIQLSSGYNDDVEFKLLDDQSRYFDLNVTGNSAQLVILEPIPPAIISANQHLVFSILAKHPTSHEAYATIIISLVDEYEESLLLGFERINYLGKLEENSDVDLEPIILAQGFSDAVTFELYGVMTDYFTVSQGSANPYVTLIAPLPEDFISANNVVLLTLEASAPQSMPAYATIIIEIMKVETKEEPISFSQTYYVGSYNTSEGLIFEKDIILSEGYDDNVNFTLEGDDSQWFHLNQDGDTSIISLDGDIPQETLINQNQLIFLIEARKQDIIARATIIITLITTETNVFLRFEEVNYLGTIQDNVSKLDSIVLLEGYSENVEFSLNGDLSENFDVSWNREIVSITLKENIPESSIPPNRLLIYDLRASEPNARPAYTSIIFEVILNENCGEIYFDKVIYEGKLEGDNLQHETITLVGHNGDVEILGDLGSLFTVTLSNNIVTVETLGTIVIPDDQTILTLELKAASASAVLVAQVEHTETPMPPAVSFDSEIYALSVDVEQTGLVGRVTATASNSETVTYELILDNEHLKQRLSINNEGEVHLSAPAAAGTYSFNIQATSVVSKVTATTTAHLTVTAIRVCSIDDKVVPPLIIIDRDEEEPHHSLVPLNTEEWRDCQYIMNNRWPLNQTWLYVDENGLHATAIDRENPSIAFMASSQIQIELTLQCNDDSNTRRKRPIETTSANDLLGPYDYGTNKWVLTDTIHFNSRRSFVNLIVNDINDNAPIFVGKENEPVAVGYPVASLVGVILPRALAELEATDADIGENALIRYWSEESVLAVSPTTGSIHVRVGEELENDMRLIVQATDRFGEGLTGTIELVVKLVDSRHIAVVTVRDAFLDDEKTILDDLSKSVGYEVKALRSVITSDETQSDVDEEETRVKREVNDTGSSLVLYIYGLVDREPIDVEQLTRNVTEVSSAVNIVRTVSLEDHLVSDQICVISTRETALLVSTIVLSVLLFMLIAAIAFWFCLKWWRNRNYNEFQDESSLNSDKVLETAKLEIPKPRPNIDDIKRSERRLQEMLDLVVEEPTPSITTEPTIPTPNVIQSFDKLKDDDDSDVDEFGEIKKPSRRKSVVTFNENVEKIIHLEDDAEPTADDDSIEIFQF